MVVESGTLDEGGDIFYAVESTDCLSRQIKQCCPDCAPWNVEMLLLGSKYKWPWVKTNGTILGRMNTHVFCCSGVQGFDPQPNFAVGSLFCFFAFGKACCHVT